jgi:catechol 2,3-dioxygenase-like lactoylglutathione lyase family enzyme
MTGDPLIGGLVPMIFVSDVDRSAAFYRSLGFEIGNHVPPGAERKEWAWLYSPAAGDWKRGPNLMLTRAETPAPGKPEGVLFYLYAPDLPSLRARLIEAGLGPGEITYPDYLPNGEMCLQDPDGYTLMIAQSAHDTP